MSLYATETNTNFINIYQYTSFLWKNFVSNINHEIFAIILICYLLLNNVMDYQCTMLQLSSSVSTLIKLIIIFAKYRVLQFYFIHFYHFHNYNYIVWRRYTCQQILNSKGNNFELCRKEISIFISTKFFEILTVVIVINE